MVEPQTESQASNNNGRAASVRDGLIGGVHGAHSVANEGLGMIRDVASDTVRAAGEVGAVAVDTTRGLLVGVADGLRDVVTHIASYRHSETAGRGREAEPRQ